MARARHYRQAGRGEPTLQHGRALLVALAFGVALFEVTYRPERAGGDRRRQRGREDEARRVTAQKIDERRGTRDIAADRAKGLTERALDYGRAVHDPVALGNAAARRPVKPHGMHLVEISHRPELLGDIAELI